MAYEIGDLPIQSLLPALARAEDQLARLDEIVRRSAVGDGVIQRGHFFDSVASMWVSGQLVHIEDLVLHDADMDIRAPTHELTLAHAILRTRRRIAGADPDWAISEAGMTALGGAAPIKSSPDRDAWSEAEIEMDDDDDPLSREFAAIDAVIDRSRRVIDGLEAERSAAPAVLSSLVIGDLVIRDADWDEQERLTEYRKVMKQVETLPPALAAAVLFDAWETLEPLHRRHDLGGQLVSAYLRSRRKVTSHIPTFNVGLKALPRERRRAQTRSVRLSAFLEAMTAAADFGMKEVYRLSQARDQMERKLRGRRSSSSLPAVMDLVLTRPIVSAPMIAKAARVTTRGALNLIADLGVREMTGRGRYRAWGVI